MTPQSTGGTVADSIPQSLADVGHLPTHVAQFYERDTSLCDAVAGVLAKSAAAGQPILVIATPAHRESIAARLASLNKDIARGRSRVLWLDARDTLSTFMKGPTVDAEQFRLLMGDALKTLRADGPGMVCAYGEMVDVLQHDGKAAAALRLEELWNELATTQSFALVCGYATAGFPDGAQSESVLALSRQHQHVFLAEGERQPVEVTRIDDVAALQQRARALESELERHMALDQAARSANRLKDEFLAVISHELRTPLNAILGWTQIASRPDADAAIMRRALTVIERNARLQLHVINDVLDMSRIITGKMALQTTAVDLLSVLNDVIETVQPAAMLKAIELDLRVDDLARAVIGDRDRLQQILWNLLSNAIKFTPMRGRVEVRLDRVDGQAQIMVRDNGQGIAPAFLPWVFDRFRQADTSTTRTNGGLGLGLALVRHLVEAHGGTVSAASAGEGLGAAFTVRLPIRSASIDMAPLARAPVSAGLHDRHVLVVDDEPDAREVLEIMLHGSGASVRTAASVDEAWHLLATGQFDALVADIVMPEWDGYALIDLVRRHPKESVRGICAVAVTSYVGERYRERVLEAGYDHYLPKPIEPGRLAQVIEDALRRQRQA